MIPTKSTEIFRAGGGEGVGRRKTFWGEEERDCDRGNAEELLKSPVRVDPRQCRASAG